MLPSLREKKRYIGFEVISESEIDFKETKEAINSSFRRLVGDFGLAKAGMIFLKDWKNQKGIIRVANTEVDKLKAAMALVQDVSGKKVIVRSFAVSGIIEKIRKKL